MEFHGNHFSSQLRGNLLYIQYNAVSNIYRTILTSDGRATIASLDKQGLAMNIGNLGLDLTQAPNGNLVETRYGNSSIFYYKPVEGATTDLVVKTCFPRRGRSSGGNILSVYGVNLNSRHPTVIVMVGGISCPTTFTSSTRVDCRLSGGVGTVDIVVTNGGMSSTFERGYRYISGTPPVGFTIPVYGY
jgi:IPT/TIG domain